MFRFERQRLGSLAQLAVCCKQRLHIHVRLHCFRALSATNSCGFHLILSLVYWTAIASEIHRIDGKRWSWLISTKYFCRPGSPHVDGAHVYMWVRSPGTSPDNLLQRFRQFILKNVVDLPLQFFKYGALCYIPTLFKPYFFKIFRARAPGHPSDFGPLVEGGGGNPYLGY